MAPIISRITQAIAGGFECTFVAFLTREARINFQSRTELQTRRWRRGLGEALSASFGEFALAICDGGRLETVHDEQEHWRSQLYYGRPVDRDEGCGYHQGAFRINPNCFLYGSHVVRET